MRYLLNSVVGWIFKLRLEDIDHFVNNPFSVQQHVLAHLIEKGVHSHFGKFHDFKSIKNYEDFRRKVPIRDYSDLSPFIERILKGEEDVLWPGKIKWFAKSSGTTSSRSKFIPVSQEALEECHFKAGKDMYALYYDMFDDAHLAAGKSLVLGGSHEINQLSSESYCGDLSAVLLQNLPFWAQLKRSPDLSTALMENWEEKIEVMARETLKENITSIVGVPTWTIVLIQRLFELTGKDNLAEIWPDLELYIHGGVGFNPYRNLFSNMIRKEKMRYMETYNASEGFFGIQNDLSSSNFLLMLDYGIFYEFQPTDIPDAEAIPLEEVKTGVNYALIISTNAGLWRYKIGDTVTFDSINPYKIRITGRTKQFINAFGEELIVENADRAIEIISKETGIHIYDYTAAPVFFTNNKKGSHEWVIETDSPDSNQQLFAERLDSELKNQNSDYAAKRAGDMALHLPKVHLVNKGTFYQWMKLKGKLGGQNKVPRLSNNREYIDDILECIDQKKIHA